MVPHLIGPGAGSPLWVVPPPPGASPSRGDDPPEPPEVFGSCSLPVRADFGRLGGSLWVHLASRAPQRTASNQDARKPLVCPSSLAGLTAEVGRPSPETSLQRLEITATRRYNSLLASTFQGLLGRSTVVSGEVLGVRPEGTPRRIWTTVLPWCAPAASALIDRMDLQLRASTSPRLSQSARATSWSSWM